MLRNAGPESQCVRRRRRSRAGSRRPKCRQRQRCHGRHLRPVSCTGHDFGVNRARLTGSELDVQRGWLCLPHTPRTPQPHRPLPHRFRRGAAASPGRPVSPSGRLRHADRYQVWRPPTRAAKRRASLAMSDIHLAGESSRSTPGKGCRHPLCDTPRYGYCGSHDDLRCFSRPGTHSIRRPRADERAERSRVCRSSC